MKYALLSAEDYAALNTSISSALGYNVGEPTERYAPITPELAKVNVTYDEVEHYDTTCVMPITAEVQERFPEILTSLNLVDTYIRVEANI